MLEQFISNIWTEIEKLQSLGFLCFIVGKTIFKLSISAADDLIIDEICSMIEYEIQVKTRACKCITKSYLENTIATLNLTSPSIYDDFC